jgi:hypothetical protein
MSLLAARELGGGACPGRYLPVSTPWASGDQTIWEMPLAAHNPNSSASGARQSIEYSCPNRLLSTPATGAR